MSDPTWNGRFSMFVGGLVMCTECAAAVVAENAYTHIRWHDRIDDIQDLARGDEPTYA